MFGVVVGSWSGVYFDTRELTLNRRLGHPLTTQAVPVPCERTAMERVLGVVLGVVRRTAIPYTVGPKFLQRLPADGPMDFEPRCAASCDRRVPCKSTSCLRAAKQSTAGAGGPPPDAARPHPRRCASKRPDAHPSCVLRARHHRSREAPQPAARQLTQARVPAMSHRQLLHQRAHARESMTTHHHSATPPSWAVGPREKSKLSCRRATWMVERAGPTVPRNPQRRQTVGACAALFSSWHW